MIQILERMYLHIRQMGVLFFIPFLGYFILIPLTVCAMGLNPIKQESVMDRMTSVCYSLVPILSTWWIYLIHKEFIEGEGREILILGKGICVLTGLFFVLNIFCFLPVFIVDKMSGSDGTASNLFFQMIVVSFMTCGMAFFLSFSLQSIPISALIVMSFCILSIVPNEKFQEYQFSVLQGDSLWHENAIPFIIAGGIFSILGIFRARKF